MADDFLVLLGELLGALLGEVVALSATPFLMIAAMLVLIGVGIVAYGRHKTPSFIISDQYSTMEEVQHALRAAGLESSNLIVGIDYTRSNEWTGAKSFGKMLHTIDHHQQNPYQEAIAAIGGVLEAFDDDTLIPVYGFGDERTQGHSVFPLNPNAVNNSCQGFKHLLDCYDRVTPGIKLSGPTSFAPLIREAMRIVQVTGQYHILVILADGQVCDETATVNAIVEASRHPLSIIMVGVGDGPWDQMHTFDDELPERKFDNFQFVNFTAIQTRLNKRHISQDARQATLGVHCLQEIPDQYKTIKRLGLLKSERRVYYEPVSVAEGSAPGEGT